jgi:8-oxo-dGTP diphosphatase
VIKVTCALIVDDRHRLLVAQRSRMMSLPLKWEFPGGKIEPNETAEACLIREIKEELNIDVVIIKELPSNTHVYPTATIRLIPFLCRHVAGEVILNEHNDFRWLNRNELLDLDWAEADIPILNRYLET